MKSVATFIAFAAAAAAQQYRPFEIDYMTTHQPNGVPSGQVNYYRIAFNVTSANGDEPVSAYCSDFWGDNSNNRLCSGSSCVPYSTEVPTGSWIDCAQNSSATADSSSGFAFQLFPYFSIGNFSVMIKQNFSEAGSQIIAQSAPYLITNTTDYYVCDILGSETSPSSHIGQHARGDCQLAANASAISIAVANASQACDHATSVNVSFPVTETTLWGETVFVTGNITELGNWDPSSSPALNADGYTSSNNEWSGGVEIPAGTAFEYKYVQQNLDGSYTWECGENRVFTVSDFTCGDETAGNDPDYFRCGNH
ncbi:carbohydrate-binding module family 20 protein [Polychaeton citri CBS 116435]|uniref:Carbohydrate-binding module family 20 protein n=1 Tax=Polychaeton citri CBS 116435 TaxID=1314669 RepID=A0A9P4QJM0_9PEZI|nr:carbohydrate-binding module family 20 protein [Polychaeton citri CBS 116435]